MLSAPPLTPLSMIRGNDKTWEVALTRYNPDTGLTTPIDLTGATLYFTVRTSANAPSSPLIQKTVGTGITVTDAAQGELTITLSAADTLSFATAMALMWDLRLVEENGNASTPLLGTLFVAADVTR